MTNLVMAYQRKEIKEFEKILKSKHHPVCIDYKCA